MKKKKNKSMYWFIRERENMGDKLGGEDGWLYALLAVAGFFCILSSMLFFV